MYTKRQIENWSNKLKDQEPIKFKVEREIKSLKDILLICMNRSYSSDNSTVFLNDKLQCFSNRTRSAQDIYLLAKRYKTDITFEEVIDFMIKLVEARQLNYSYCYTVRRNVFSKNTYSPSYPYTQNNLKKFIEDNNLDIKFDLNEHREEVIG